MGVPCGKTRLPDVFNAAIMLQKVAMIVFRAQKLTFIHSNAEQLAACASVGVADHECDEGRLVAVLVKIIFQVFLFCKFLLLLCCCGWSSV